MASINGHVIYSYNEREFTGPRGSARVTEMLRRRQVDIVHVFCLIKQTFSRTFNSSIEWHRCRPHNPQSFQSCARFHIRTPNEHLRSNGTRRTFELNMQTKWNHIWRLRWFASPDTAPANWGYIGYYGRLALHSAIVYTAYTAIYRGPRLCLSD